MPANIVHFVLAVGFFLCAKVFAKGAASIPSKARLLIACVAASIPLSLSALAAQVLVTKLAALCIACTLLSTSFCIAAPMLRVSTPNASAI